MSANVELAVTEHMNQLTNAICNGYRPNAFLPLGEAVASRAVFVIVFRSDGRAKTLLEPAK